MEGLSPWDRAALFSWRSRSNCFMCFYQRRYEWVGLLEHHPDLFDRAAALEVEYGTPPLVAAEFTWIPGLPLAELRAKADAIFANRVKQVSLALAERSQGRLFHDEFDPLTVTSCGLFCGK